MTNILLGIEYTSIIAFTLNGGRSVKIKQTAFLSCFLYVFGGGLFRDLIILHCRPAILDCQVHVVIFACVFFIRQTMDETEKRLHTKMSLKLIVSIFEAAGVGIFVASGVNIASACYAPPAVQILAGTVTGIGGGILSAWVAGQNLHDIIRCAKLYRLTVILGTLLYYSCIDLSPQNPIAPTIALTVSFAVLIPYQSWYGKHTKSRCQRYCVPKKSSYRVFRIPTPQRLRDFFNPYRGRIFHRIICFYSASGVQMAVQTD